MMGKALFFVLLISAASAALPSDGVVFIPNDQESRLYQLIRDRPEQRRSQVILDPRLCMAARGHALDMQARRYFSHTSPDGVNSNSRVISQGYPLPASYLPNRNFIESIAGSVVGTPDDAFNLWRGSQVHENHVFGGNDFHLSQVVIRARLGGPLSAQLSMMFEASRAFFSCRALHCPGAVGVSPR